MSTILNDAEIFRFVSNCCITYLQVSGNSMVGSMGDYEDAVSLADQAVTHLYLTCMPLGDACPHDGHAQLGVVGVVQLPV